MKRFLAVILAVAMILSLSACNGNQNTNEVSDPENMTSENTVSTINDEPFRLGFGSFPACMLWYLARDKGIFEANNVNVELVYFPVSSDSYSAFYTDNVDGVIMSATDSIPAINRGIDLSVPLITDFSCGVDGIVCQSGIESIEDLRGKKVGTELYNILHLFLLSALSENGMTQDDIDFVNMSISDSGVAFIGGELDAAVLWEPYLSAAVEEGGGKKLYTSADAPTVITDIMAVHGEYINNNREIVKAVIQSWFDVYDYYLENKEEAAAICSQYMESTPEEFLGFMDGLKIPTKEECLKALTKADSDDSVGYVTNRLAGYLYEMEVIESVPDYNDVLDISLVKELSD